MATASDLPRRIWQRDPKEASDWRNVLCVSPPRRFANPFIATESRTSADEFRYWLTAFVRPELDTPGLRRRRLQILLDLHELQGRPLSCTCTPDQVCHATHLIWLANRQLDFARILARRALWVPPDAESIVKRYRHLGTMPQCVAAVACCAAGALVDVFRDHDRVGTFAMKLMMRKLFGISARIVKHQTQFRFPDYGVAFVEPLATNTERTSLRIGTARVCATAWDGANRYIYEPELGHGNGAWVRFAEWNSAILQPWIAAWKRKCRVNLGSWRVKTGIGLWHPEHVRILIGDSKRQRMKMRWRPTTPVMLPSPLNDPETAARYGIHLSPEDCHAKTTCDDSNAATDLQCPPAGHGLPRPGVGWDNYSHLPDRIEGYGALGGVHNGRRRDPANV